MLATRAEGNWLRGAATGARELRAWDQAETARLYERSATAAAEMSPALVNLLLMSPELQRLRSVTTC
jgi:hypothetical protein